MDEMDALTMRRDVKDANPPNGPMWGKGIVRLKDCSWCGLMFTVTGDGDLFMCPLCDTPEVKVEDKDD